MPHRYPFLLIDRVINIRGATLHLKLRRTKRVVSD
jgi:3-hydroxymyristoyl/3-hydroxydecanoyl-(acyl carrier protein) dehydratase